MPNITTPVEGCKFILSDEVQYIGDISISNCSFCLAEGVTARRFSFNKRDALIKFMNCDFRGGLYELTNHNIFNSGEFTNCNFDKFTVNVNCALSDNTKTIVVKNCTLPIDGCLIKLASNAYSKGIVNVIFEDCIITDSGEFTLDCYGAGSALINAFSKPMEGSSITFRNCTIDKPTGLLLEGYNATGWKLDLIFENTPLSDNLRILNGTQKQCVNLIIK